VCGAALAAAPRLVALGDALIAGGKDERAVIALREAVELFDREEATVPAAQARARIEEPAPV